MRPLLSVLIAAFCMVCLPNPAAAQSKAKTKPRLTPKPKLQAIDGFMFKGVFTELDREQMTRRLSLSEISERHFDGTTTEIEEILKLMSRSEKLKYRIEEPLEVRGEIPVTLPPNTMGNEAYTTCFYAFNLNGLVVAGSGDQLVLIRAETRPEAPRLDRKWNREEILPIRLFRLGYLRSDMILAQYGDKLGTSVGRAILDAKSNMVLVADKAASLDKLGRFIDVETLEAMGVPAGAGHLAGEGLRPPSLGAIAGRANIHFYLMAFARFNRIPVSGSKKEGEFDKHYPEADVWIPQRGYRALEAEFNRVNEYFQLAQKTTEQEWPVRDDQRALSPVEQGRLDIHFGVLTPEPASAPPAKAKTKKGARKR